MLKTRLIPVLLLKDGYLVRSENFNDYQVIGHPLHEVKRFNEWNVDELIYLNISHDDVVYQRREDHGIKGLLDPLSILDEVSKTCFMPLTWGGRIRTIEQMRECFARGADKITINSQAFRTPELITEAAKTFGSQAIVVCIDALRHPDGHTEVFLDGRAMPTGRTPADWAKEAEDRGAGEILLQSIDRDGSGRGYDLELIHDVAAVTTIPIIALGGIGLWEQYAQGIKAGASAAAAANLWHFKELADRQGKRAMARAGIEVRL
jgi:cyclase